MYYGCSISDREIGDTYTVRINSSYYRYNSETKLATAIMPPYRPKLHEVHWFNLPVEVRVKHIYTLYPYATKEEAERLIYNDINLIRPNTIPRPSTSSAPQSRPSSSFHERTHYIPTVLHPRKSEEERRRAEETRKEEEKRQAHNRRGGHSH